MKDLCLASAEGASEENMEDDDNLSAKNTPFRALVCQ